MKKSIVLNKNFAGQERTGTLKTFLKNISPFNNRTYMPEGMFVVKKLLAFVVCYWVGLFLAEALVIGGLYACGKNFLQGEMFSDDVMMLIKLYGMIVVIAVSVFYWRRIEKRKLSEMGVTKSVTDWFAGAGIGILLIFVSVFAIMMTGAIKFSGTSDDVDTAMLLLLLGGYFVQGTAEEFLSRGLVFCGLKDKVSLPAAVGANALVFTIPHLSSMSGSEPQLMVTGIINLAAISCLFSFVTLRTKNTWAACGLHSMWNFSLNCVLGLTVSGMGSSGFVINMRAVGENLLNGGVYGIEASAVTTLILIAASVLMWRSYKKDNSERKV